MDERMKFIAQLLDGHKMAALCRKFGISRKTGYKIINRYTPRGPFLLILGTYAPGQALIESLSDPKAYVPPAAVPAD